jgi:vacuolar protein sorting-associated protein 3
VLLGDSCLSSSPATLLNLKLCSVDHNLYIGTSASEILHFVQIPPDPADKSSSSAFILASRLRPEYSEASGDPSSPRPGVQQILLLPKVGKACILCNWTVTFYSLPELSPVFGTRHVKNCNWIGGLDLNEAQVENGNAQRASSVSILLSLNRKIQVVRIGDEARLVKNIDYAGSTISVRRDTIACVADSRGYALLDVERQLKIPLMSISSLDDSQPASELGHAQSIGASTGGGGGISRSTSSAQNRPLLAASEAYGHNRSTSLGGLIASTIRKHEPRIGEIDDLTQKSPTPPPPSNSPKPLGDGASTNNGATDKSLPAIPTETTDSSAAKGNASAKPGPVFLKPHIVSPTPEEFLLVTGTSPLEPGIGMFVNLDGDPTRPTVEFDRYPKEIVVDGGCSSDLSSSGVSIMDEEGYVLASMAKEFDDGIHHGLEIQRWDCVDVNPEKFWLEPDNFSNKTPNLGIRSLMGAEETHFQEIVDKLCKRRFSPFFANIEIFSLSRSIDSRTALSLERLSNERELFDRDPDSQDEDFLPEGWESTRNSEEEDFARRIAKANSRLAVWSGNKLWWAIRNPLILQLEAGIDRSFHATTDTAGCLNRQAVILVLNSIRGRDAKTELEFMSFSYIRQRAGILLLIDFLKSHGSSFSELEMNCMEEILVDSGLDPRVVLALVPGLRNEIIESRKGMWIFGGVKKIAEDYICRDGFDTNIQSIAPLGPIVLYFLKRFLGAWRRKKGFGSIADESDVFRTVDASILLIYLELDRNSPKGLGKTGSIRAELNDLVDKGVDCFDRAVTLLESYHRLFVLSRLYQSRKMSGDVLATWRRIIEGERDDGGELRDGELRVREYLLKISNQALVQEYGIWLATRNPKLGVQVFAEDRGRAPQFEPTVVVELLRQEAPDAVKYYLEYLVFGKGYTIYVNDLITYYLDIVLGELQSSKSTREAFAGTYTAYRALQPPKPTYRQFLTENAPEDDEVWGSRLRLLQLLGGAHDYDAAAIRRRIATLPDELLVPETIILNGRERRHEDALRLLVHKLGDYDTAVSYCLRGGSSIYTPPDGRRDSMPTRHQQAKLFQAVLGEFLVIEDVNDRIEQTGALLQMFGGWFDVEDVLKRIPDNWSVEVVAGFLVSGLRRLVQEKHESIVTRALSSAENLRVNHDLIVKMDEQGPSIEAPN